MAKIKIKNQQTGEIKEIDDSQMSQFGLSPQGATPVSKSTDGQKTITGHTIEEHAQALSNAKSAGDTAMVKQITDDYDREYKYQLDFAKKPDEETADDKKKNSASKSILNFIDTLEKRYQEADGGNTNLGALTRVLGLANSAESAVGLNPEGNVFQRERKGFIASLKDLSGDTGVLTQQDADRLIGLIPDFGSTEKEARLLFSDLRKQAAATLGAENTKSNFNPKEKNAFEALLPGVNDYVVRTSNDFKRAQEIVKSGDVEEAKKLMEEYKSTGNIAADLVTKGKARENLPAALEIATLVEVPGLAKTVINAPKTIISGQGGSGAMFRPAVAGKTLRNEVVAQADEARKAIPGKSIVEAMTKWGDDAVKANPGEEAAIKKIIESVKASFSKGNVKPSDAFKIYSEVDSGFTQSGLAKTPVRAQADLALRKTLRGLIDEVAPGFDRGTKMISTGINRGKVIKKYVLPYGAGAAGLAAQTFVLNKILGQKGGNQ